MSDALRGSILMALVFPASIAGATTWTKTSVEDPIVTAKCEVQEPASFGSYVYDWPEKYDQVFWPLTDPNGVWLCGESGFVSFIGDMDISPGEKEKIAGYLKTNPLPKSAEIGLSEKLQRLQAIYALRDLDADQGIRITRALAYHFESLGEQQHANELRLSAFDRIKARLNEASLPIDLRLQYLFVNANYAREFGNSAEADLLLKELRAALSATDKEEIAGYIDYLKGLIDSSEKIEPGGKLAPGA